MVWLDLLFPPSLPSLRGKGEKWMGTGGIISFPLFPFSFLYFSPFPEITGKKHGREFPP